MLFSHLFLVLQLWQESVSWYCRTEVPIPWLAICHQYSRHLGSTCIPCHVATIIFKGSGGESTPSQIPLMLRILISRKSPVLWKACLISSDLPRSSYLKTKWPGTSVTFARCLHSSTLFPCGSDSKESACKAGDPGLIPGSERSPGEGNFSIFAWRIPRTEEPGWLQSMGSQRVRHNWVMNTHKIGRRCIAPSGEKLGSCLWILPTQVISRLNMV